MLLADLLQEAKINHTDKSEMSRDKKYSHAMLDKNEILKTNFS